jgi:hypothetical protein
VDADVLTLPPVLRSRRALEDSGISLLAPGSLAPTDLPIAERGTTYSMAQEATWLDAAHFAVGRWDGSLSVFSFENAPTTGPEITVAASDASSEGVQMPAFVSSGGESQLTVWVSPTGGWQRIAPTQYPYSQSLGAANSAVLNSGPPGLLAVGHASGFLSLWQVALPGPTLAWVTQVDLRNPHPVNPWGIHNIRGTQLVRTGVVVTGSEDGYLSVLDIVNRRILAQVVYNPAATRGINSIAVRGSDLLVANCSVGRGDSNLWYFTLNPSTLSPEFADRALLMVNSQAQQVFNFCTAWATYSQGPCFFCSTEEGALWMGVLGREKLETLGYLQLPPALGSSIANQPDGRLALVGYDLHQFDSSKPRSSPGLKPQ